MRRRWMIRYGAGLLGLIGMATILSLMLVPQVSIEQVRHNLEVSLPLGTSKADAKRWLLSQSNTRFHGEVADAKTGRVTGMAAEIPNSGPRWDSSQRIELLLFFDDDKLSRIQVNSHVAPYVFP